MHVKYILPVDACSCVCILDTTCMCWGNMLLCTICGNECKIHNNITEITLEYYIIRLANKLYNQHGQEMATYIHS